MVTDPICGMAVNPEEAIKITKDGRDYFFCSTHCKEKFLQQEGMTQAAVCYPQARQPFFKNRLFIVSAISFLLILASLFIPALEPFRKAFFVYLKAIWWAVLLGLFLSGIIDRYIPREYISRILARKSPFTILNAVCLGFLMRACSNGI